MEKVKKKGVLTLTQMPGAIILFSVAVIVTSVMAVVLTNMLVVSGYSAAAANGCNSTVTTSCNMAYNITQQGLTGLNTFAGFFNPIAVILAAVIIIGLIMSAFIYSKAGEASGGV